MRRCRTGSDGWRPAAEERKPSTWQDPLSSSCTPTTSQAHCYCMLWSGPAAAGKAGGDSWRSPCCEHPLSPAPGGSPGEVASAWAQRSLRLPLSPWKSIKKVFTPRLNLAPG